MVEGLSAVCVCVCVCAPRACACLSEYAQEKHISLSTSSDSKNNSIIYQRVFVLILRDTALICRYDINLTVCMYNVSLVTFDDSIT